MRARAALSPWKQHHTATHLQEEDRIVVVEIQKLKKKVSERGLTGVCDAQL
jgi:hypothetical protein